MVSNVSKAILLLSSAVVLVPKSVVAQNIYATNVFGATGPSDLGEEIEQRFDSAARSPLVSNNASFPGFNFAAQPSTTGDFSNLRIDANWTLQLNYSVTVVSAATDNTTQLVSAVVFDLKLPNDEPLPQQNNTNWTMCNYFALDAIKPKGSAADETGDCMVTLGEDCLNSYRNLWLSNSLSASGSNSCSSPPSLSSISECRSVTGDNGLSFGWSAAMSWLGKDSPRNSTERYGLNSTQPLFAKTSENYNDTGSNVSNYFDEYADAMRLVVFTFQPTGKWLESNAPETPSTTSRQVQIVCQRAANAQSDSQGAASATKISGLLMTVVAVLVVIFQS